MKNKLIVLVLILPVLLAFGCKKESANLQIEPIEQVVNAQSTVSNCWTKSYFVCNDTIATFINGTLTISRTNEAIRVPSLEQAARYVNRTPTDCDSVTIIREQLLILDTPIRCKSNLLKIWDSSGNYITYNCGGFCDLDRIELYGSDATALDGLCNFYKVECTGRLEPL